MFLPAVFSSPRMPVVQCHDPGESAGSLNDPIAFAIWGEDPISRTPLKTCFWDFRHYGKNNILMLQYVSKSDI